MSSTIVKYCAHGSIGPRSHRKGRGQMACIDGSEDSLDIGTARWKTIPRGEISRGGKKNKREDTRRKRGVWLSGWGRFRGGKVTLPGRRIAAKSLRASRAFLDEYSCPGSSAFEFSGHLPPGHRSPRLYCIGVSAFFRSRRRMFGAAFVRRVARRASRRSSVTSRREVQR